jgi:hypothetical protein
MAMKPNANGSLISMLPQQKVLETKLFELVLEAKKTLATIKFLDELENIEAGSTGRELELLECDTAELEDSLPAEQTVFS